MRILVATQEGPPALRGPTVWLLGLLRALRPLHQVGLVVPRDRDLAAFDQAGVAPVFTVPTFAAADAGEASRFGTGLAEFARRQEVDLVHLAGAPLAPLAPSLTAAGLPSVLTLLGADLPPLDGPGDRGEPLDLAAALARASRVTAVSRAAAARAAEMGFGGPVRVIPPGIDLTRFQPGNRDVTRRALDLPPDRPVLLMVGRLLVAKGLLEALEALRLLADLDPLLVFVGDGPDAERLDARARFLGVEARVRRAGAAADDLLLQLYQAADVALLPARDEAAAGLALAAVEAAACGLPVAGSRAGALAEVVEDGRTGALAPPRDAPALAAALRGMLTDPEGSATLGREARRRAEKVFRWDTAASDFAEVYRQAVLGQAVLGDPAPPESGAHRPPRQPRPRPRIAVFLPAWPDRRGLARAIQGVLDQTWPHVDLYVGDIADAAGMASSASGSPDPEMAALEERFPAVTFLTLREQDEPCQLDGLLLSLTESELVAFHDAGGWSRPDRFALQAGYLLERGFHICGSWRWLSDLNGDPIGFDTVPEHTVANRDGPFPRPAALYRREVFAPSPTPFSTFEVGNVQRFLYRQTVHPGPSGARAGKLADGPMRSRGEVLRLRPGRGNRTLKEPA